jgi:serine/threonine protein kinase
MALASGARLGPYEILTLVGAGGMGEVYRARDTRLDRQVAIKIVSATRAGDREARQRFEREARAASSLSHPHICPLFDVGEATLPSAASPQVLAASPVAYLVMEYCDGETLASRLKKGAMPIDQMLRYAIEIASALDAAHRAGIVHRDLKPGNVMLTRAGAKLLDFGLAKAAGPPKGGHYVPPGGDVAVRSVRLQPDVSDATTQAAPLTSEGTILGTFNYMAPEQLEGKEVDARADLFAFGAVVYEMATGRKAFDGATQASVIAAIIDRDPSPMTTLQLLTPPALERLIRRCLVKDPDDRWQTARDLLAELKWVSNSATAVPTDGGSIVARRADRRRTRVWIAAVAITAAVSAIAVGVYVVARHRSEHTSTSSPALSQWQKMTNFADSVTSPALSSDGRVLAFVHGPSTFVSSGDIFIQVLPNGEPVQLTHDGGPKMSPMFSPDGSRIAYSVSPTWDTWAVPVLGGEPQLMLPNASGLSWIDDRHVLFSELKQGVHMALVTAGESRAGERDVYVPELETGMAHRSSISPDHKWVLLVEMDSAKVGWMPCRLVPFEARSMGKPVGPADAMCTSAGWSPDGKWMFFSSNKGGGYHIWRQPFPDGEPEQLGFGPAEQDGIAISPDGHSLYTSVGLIGSTTWVHEPSNDLQISLEDSAGFPGPQVASRSVFSPDGAKLYFLGLGLERPAELRVTALTSGVSERVLPGISIPGSYDISPDGKQIVFDSIDNKGQSGVWIAALDHRSPPHPIDSRSGEHNPIFGPAGDLFFSSDESSGTYVYRALLDGSERQKVTSSPIVRLETISADGQWVVAEASVSGEDVTRGVIAYRVRDGMVKRICRSLCIVRWTLNGKALFITLVGGNNSNLYKTFVVPLPSGQSFPDLPTGGIRSKEDVTQLLGVHVIDEVARPGPDASRYAYAKQTVKRNIYRIPIP